MLPKSTNLKEIKILKKFLNPIIKKINKEDIWESEDFGFYNALIRDGRFIDGIPEGLLKDYSVRILTFEEFERLILNKEVEPNYEIY